MTKHLLNPAKNIAIVVLAALSLYQTGRLWFEDGKYPNIPGMFNFGGDFRPSEAELSALSTPARVLKSDGEFPGKFYAAPAPEGSEEKNFLEDCVRKILAEGGGFSAPAPETAPGGTARLIFEYGFIMPPDVFALCFSSKSNALASGIQGFDSVTAKLAGVETILLTFANSESGETAAFSITDESLAGRLSALASGAGSAGGFYYVSGKDLGLNQTGKTTFIAAWGENGYDFFSLNVINPYAQNDSPLQSLVEKKVSVFFDNPSHIWMDVRSDAGIYTFSDESTVVKYHSNSLLEYSSTKINTKAADSFLSAYSAALDMLGRDITIENGFFLSGYDRADGAWIFRFDFTVGDMPVFFSESARAELGMDSMIEITVVNDIVTKYRRYVAVLELDPTYSLSAVNDFSAAARSVLGSLDELEPEALTGLELGYRLDGGLQATLFWRISAYGNVYSVPAE